MKLLAPRQREIIRSQICGNAKDIGKFMKDTPGRELYARAIGRRKTDFLKITPRLRYLANRLPLADSKESLEELVRRVRRKVERTDTNDDVVDVLYLHRTADEIMESGRAVSQKKNAIAGCQDYTIAIMGILKAQKSVPRRDMRYIHYKKSNGQAHTVAEVKINGRVYYLDGLWGKVHDSDSVLAREIRKARFNRNIRAGATPLAAGVTTLAESFPQRWNIGTPPEALRGKTKHDGEH